MTFLSVRAALGRVGRPDEHAPADSSMNTFSATANILTPTLSAQPRLAARRAEYIELVLLVTVALAACVAGMRNSFTQDDVALIAESEHLHGFSQWRAMLASPYWPPPYASDQFRPVTSLVLAAEYVIGGGAPVAYRFASYVLYALAALAVFRLGARLFPRPMALAAALLFAAHPVHVEAVALAVGQSEILLTIIVVYVTSRYVDWRRDGNGVLTGRRWAVLAVLYAVAALTKEQGFLLPMFVLLAEALLVDHAPWTARASQLWKGYTALAVTGAMLFAWRVAVLGGQTLQPHVAEALTNKTLAGRAVTMLQIVPEWLRLFVWPAHLRADYSPQEFIGSSTFGAKESLGLALLLTGGFVAWASRRRMPRLSFGLAWCALALFPVSNVFIPTGVLIAERTLFLPSVGAVIAAIASVAALLEKWPHVLRTHWRPALVAMCGVFVTTGVIHSARRQLVWRDNTSLTLATVQDAPRSWRAQQNYGDVLFEQDSAGAAKRAYLRAIELAPSPWWVRNSLAYRLRVVGRDAEAVEQLRLSLVEYPAQLEAVPELVAALIAVGNYGEARAIASRVIATAGAPTIMVWLRNLADSALAVDARPGTIRVGVRGR